MDRQVGNFIITYELLGNLLNIPKDHKIISVYSRQSRPFIFFATVEGPDMPSMFEGSEVMNFNRFPDKWLENLEKKEE